MTRDSTYHSLQIGISKEFQSNLIYREQKPIEDLKSIVGCFWTLKNSGKLTNDFVYTVMPDACVDIVFDVKHGNPVLLMTPHLKIEEINLGTDFHYIGIRFMPGALVSKTFNLSAIVGQQQDILRIGEIDLENYSVEIRRTNDEKKQYTLLENLVRNMQGLDYAQSNILVNNVVTGLQFGVSLQEISKKSGYSTRQLRRKVHTQTGFTPIQLHRIIRFQMALSSQDISLRFSDQSHLIKEFRRITGVSFKTFTNSFL